MRSIDRWRPPFGATDSRQIAVGQVIAWEFAAWEVTHLGERAEPNDKGHDMRATLHRLHGPKRERENDRGDVAISYHSNWRPEVYRDGRVWLCSCCGHPAPCRMTIAEEESARAAKEFEARLGRMGPGICYGCGEVITTRQEKITFPGEHADFPGRGAPTFHARNACYAERAAYGRRAGLDANGLPLLPFCEGHSTRHGDDTYECSRGEECPGSRAQHRSMSICRCSDPGCPPRDCTLRGTEVRR